MVKAGDTLDRSTASGHFEPGLLPMAADTLATMSEGRVAQDSREEDEEEMAQLRQEHGQDTLVRQRAGRVSVRAAATATSQPGCQP